MTDINELKQILEEEKNLLTENEEKAKLRKEIYQIKQKNKQFKPKSWHQKLLEKIFFIN